MATALVGIETLDWELYYRQHAVFRSLKMSPEQLEAGDWRMA